LTIKEIQLVSHTHTDFGFTDYPDTVFRHHNRIIDRAIDICEAEAGRDERAQFRWTCEVAAITANWFRSASSRQKDRFLALHRDGRMGVGGMLVHWTPLITPANAARSMRTIDFLRRQCELDVNIAWQCDVNGLGWHWVDLLIDMGMDGMVLAPNPHRGMPFETQQRVFNWQAPSGRTLLALHGWHYSVGAWGFFLGDDDMDKTQSAIDRMLGNLERRGGYDFETILCQVTNPAAIDNGFPTNISAFVERWNAEGRTPMLRLATLDQAVSALKADAAIKDIPTWRGDWSDYWVDGVGSTAYETALNRASERHLPALELIGALRDGGEPGLLARAADALQFYDEHTWGAFCSVIGPDSPFTRSHLSWKTGRAYEGFALVQEALAEEARGLARERTGGPVENDFPIRRGQQGPTAIEEQSYYVLNTGSVPLKVRWPVTWDYGGAAPQTILHAHLSDEYHQGMKVDRQGFASSPTHVIEVDLPPFGEAVVKPIAVTQSEAGMGDGYIETAAFRLEVDLRDGSIASLRRKSDGMECVDAGRPMGRLIYEALKDPARSRSSIFGETGDWQYDWSRLETIAWPKTAPEFSRSTADAVTIGAPRLTIFGPEIDVHLAWAHGDSATLTYRLPTGADHVEMRLVVDKQPIEDP
jgi:alpha-mannosidase